MFYQEPVIFQRVEYPMSNYLHEFGDTSEFQWTMSPSTPSDRLDDDFGYDIKSEGMSTPPLCSTPELSLPFNHPVPTASIADVTASLQSAFCRRPSIKGAQEVNGQNNPIKQEILESDPNRLNNNNAYPYAHTMLPGQPFEVTGEAAEGVDPQQFDIYRDLFLRHLIQDISTTCARLGLPTDANRWNAEQSWKWIREMCEQFNLPLPQRSGITGAALLQMNQRDFEDFAPQAGDTLYAQVQLWKTAFESYQQQQSNENSGGSFGMTASENAGPKDWTTPSKTEQMSRNGFQLFPEPINGFYNGDSFQSPSMQDQLHNVFFSNGALPSPTTSELSSPGSVCDEDLDAHLNFLNLPQGPMNGMPYGGPMPEGGQPSSSHGPFRPSGTVHLWHFIRELLDQPNLYSHCVRWVDREEGTFKIESSHALARIWGQRKNRSQMNYDKLSRSLRQYYKKGIIQKPEKKQRLVYKFLPPYNL